MNVATVMTVAVTAVVWRQYLCIIRQFRRLALNCFRDRTCAPKGTDAYTLARLASELNQRGARHHVKTKMAKKRIISESPAAQALSCEPADFRDPESQRVLSAAASALVRELGRQAAREHFAAVLARSAKSKREQP